MLKIKIQKPDWLVSEKIRKLIVDVCNDLGMEIEVDEVHLEHPAEPSHGDYASNLAMAKFDEFKVKSEKLKVNNPLELADLIAEKLLTTSYELLATVEAKPPGFINFWLKKDYLVKAAKEVENEAEFKEKISKLLAGKKYLLEHTSPDPIKTIHIGHARNNFLGMTTNYLLELLGAEVTLDCINNDRGTHVSRAMWGYLAFGEKARSTKHEIRNYEEKIKGYELSDEKIKGVANNIDWQEQLQKWLENPSDWFIPQDLEIRSDKFDNCFYSLGQRSVDLIDGVGEKVQKILKQWEEKNTALRKLWRQIIDWSLQGYEKTYQRLGSHHDKVWNESDHYQEGKKWVEKGLKEGIFRKLPDGAVLSNLEKYGLTDTILIKNDGTALYHTQDLALTDQKVSHYPVDLYIWDIGNDQILYLKQLFAMCEQLGIAPRDKLFHLNFGYITLAGGEKMSSRYGGVINADDLIDELKIRFEKIIDQSDQELRGEMSEQEKKEMTEAVALAALKYGFLKYSRGKDFAFDIDASLSLQGDTGPYLQYTCARAQSVLVKVKNEKLKGKSLGGYDLNEEEISLLRTFYIFPEILISAAEDFRPHLLCQYLFNLSQKFNLFYQKHRILEPKQGSRDFRLFLTKITASILKTGLELLGIQALEQM